MLKNKKGIALNQAFGAVMVLLLVAVLVIVGIILFVNLGATFVNLSQINEVNETQTIGTTPTNMDQSVGGNSTICNYAGFAVSTVINNSGEVLPAANYTTGEKGTLALTITTGLGPWNDTALNISYSANDGGPSCVANRAMVTQFATYPALIGLVGTIIFLGIVIGVLVASFVFGGRGDRV